MTSLTAADALALRRVGQHLDRRAPASQLAEVCGAIGGAQAQVASAGRLSLGARVGGLTDEAMRRAIDTDRTLVKTWTVRGTLHFIPATDVPYYVAAFGAHRRGRVLQWLRRAGLTPAKLDKLAAAMVEALADGPLTRRGMAERVAEEHGKAAKKWIEHSWGGAIHWVVQEGRVCFGPARGTEVTFVRTDQWLGAQRTVAREDAERELTLRYLRAYGPATVHDFAYWAGLYVPDARRMWEAIEGEREPVTVDGREMWVAKGVLSARGALPARVRELSAEPAHVRVLPNFDAYLLGHRDKAAVLETKRYKRVFRNAGWISPVVLVNGRVAGTWAAAPGKRGWRAKVTRFTPLDPATKRAEQDELARIAAFLAGPRN